MFLSVKNYYPNYLNYRGPRVFSCTNPWLNEADARWERERERDSFSLSVYAVYSRSIFTKVGWKGTKAKRGGGTERGRKKSISSTRALWQRDYHGMHATHHYFRLYRFCISLFLSFSVFSFFFFCNVNAFGRCIIREIVACEKWSILPYLVKTCQREITNFGIWF